MEKQQLRLGIDRCPATNNMTRPTHCDKCDFKRTCDEEHCECEFHLYLQKNKTYH